MRSILNSLGERKGEGNALKRFGSARSRHAGGDVTRQRDAAVGTSNLVWTLQRAPAALQPSYRAKGPARAPQSSRPAGRRPLPSSVPAFLAAMARAHGPERGGERQATPVPPRAGRKQSRQRSSRRLLCPRETAVPGSPGHRHDKRERKAKARRRDVAMPGAPAPTWPLRVFGKERADDIPLPRPGNGSRPPPRC